MQNERVTILMSKQRKDAFDAAAAGLGISTGEFFRRAGDRAAAEDAEAEAALTILTGELESAVPQMRADIAAMRQSIAEARAVIAEYRAEKTSDARQAA